MKRRRARIPRFCPGQRHSARTCPRSPSARSGSQAAQLYPTVPSRWFNLLPGQVVFGLEESLELLAALEDSRDVLIASDHLSVLAQVEHQIQVLSVKP